MFCKNCGAKVEDGARFCSECGAAVAPAEAAVPPAAERKNNKKSHVAVIILAVLLVLAILVGVLFFVFVKLREEKPPLPALTEPIGTEIDSEKTTEPAATEPDGTTVPATQAGDGELTDAQAKEVLEKLVGYWNTDDDTMVLSVTREEGGSYFFALGYWYSEFVMKGYLQQPVKGDPNGVVSVWMYFEGEGSDEYYMYIPAQNGAIQFDLSDREGARLRWRNGDEWMDFYFAGATMDEARPPLD